MCTVPRTHKINRHAALERLSGYIDTYIQRDIQDLVKIRHPQVSKGIIVYGGNKIYPAASNIHAVPWTVL